MYHGKYEVSHARRDGLHAFLFVTRKIINVTLINWRLFSEELPDGSLGLMMIMILDYLS